jgi:hypothetical protein
MHTFSQFFPPSPFHGTHLPFFKRGDTEGIRVSIFFFSRNRAFSEVRTPFRSYKSRESPESTSGRLYIMYNQNTSEVVSTGQYQFIYYLIIRSFGIETSTVFIEAY